MTKIVLAALLLATAPATVVAADEAKCAFRDEPLPDAPVAGSSVTLKSTTPAGEGEVTAESVIEADVEYHLQAFTPGTFYPLGMFATSARGSMSPNDPGNTPALSHANGRAHLCVPLTGVLDRLDVQLPLSMNVAILRMTGMSGSPVATTSSVHFSTAALSPEDAARRKALSPPEGYDDALSKVFGHFDSRAARYEQCIRRFPATQPALTKIYRAWQSRHEPDREFVQERIYAHYLQIARDNPGTAMQLLDAMHGATVKRFADLPDADLKRDCGFLREDMIEGEDVTPDAISDEMKILRAWTPPKT